MDSRDNKICIHIFHSQGLFTMTDEKKIKVAKKSGTRAYKNLCSFTAKLSTQARTLSLSMSRTKWGGNVRKTAKDHRSIERKVLVSGGRIDICGRKHRLCRTSCTARSLQKLPGFSDRSQSRKGGSATSFFHYIVILWDPIKVALKTNSRFKSEANFIVFHCRVYI